MGQPSCMKVRLLMCEKLAHVERTQGTETSKYLQEKKSIEIM